MGNCIEKCIYIPKEEEETSAEKPSFLAEENVGSKDQTKSAMTIRLVLTKEELQLLLFQLNHKEGKRLEDVLDEIEKCRQRSSVGVVGSWKPSLDSITESPEVPDHMDR